MKKAIFTLGLFSMILVLTSFTNLEQGGGQSIDKGKKADYSGGGQSIDKGKKIDMEIANTFSLDYDNTESGGGQSIDKGKKQD